MKKIRLCTILYHCLLFLPFLLAGLVNTHLIMILCILQHTHTRAYISKARRRGNIIIIALWRFLPCSCVNNFNRSSCTQVCTQWWCSHHHQPKYLHARLVFSAIFVRMCYHHTYRCGVWGKENFEPELTRKCRKNLSSTKEMMHFPDFFARAMHFSARKNEAPVSFGKVVQNHHALIHVLS